MLADASATVRSLLRGEPVVGGDWLGVVEFANRHRVAPLVHDVLPADAPSSVRKRLHSLTRESLLQDVAQVKAIAQLAQLARRRGLSPPIVLKGLSLAHSVYPRPELRPRTDVDLLVAERALDGWRGVLVDQGYCRRPNVRGPTVSYQEVWRGPLATIDLHWRPLNLNCLLHALTYAELWESAQPLTLGQEPLLQPHNRHALFHAALHWANDGKLRERWITFVDGQLLSAALTEHDWTRLTRRAESTATLTILRSFLRDASENRGFSPPTIPEATRTEETSRLLARNRRVYDIVRLELASITLHQRPRYLADWLVPPRNYLASRYGDQAPSSAMLRRIVHGLSALIARG